MINRTASETDYGFEEDSPDFLAELDALEPALAGPGSSVVASSQVAPASPSKRALKPSANAPGWIHDTAAERSTAFSTTGAGASSTLGAPPLQAPPLPSLGASFLTPGAQPLPPLGDNGHTIPLVYNQALITSLIANPTLLSQPGVLSNLLVAASSEAHPPSPIPTSNSFTPSPTADHTTAVPLSPPPPIQHLQTEAYENEDTAADQLPAPIAAELPVTTSPSPRRQSNGVEAVGEEALDTKGSQRSPSPRNRRSASVEELVDEEAPNLQQPARSPRSLNKSRAKSPSSGGRPTKEQADAVRKLFTDVDATFGETAREFNLEAISLVDKYMKRFRLGREPNPWNLYEGFGIAPENSFFEMLRLKNTEHHKIYEMYEANPQLRPTVDHLKKSWPLFQQEHGDEKGKDLLLAWQSLEAMDAASGACRKADRRRTFERLTRHLESWLDMLRNVYQMNFFAIGVGGQVNMDAGLHWGYTNYESKGFAEVGFLKSLDRLLGFYRSHVFQSTREQYTDQEVAMLAESRGFTVTRPGETEPPVRTGDAPRSLLQATGPPTHSQASPSSRIVKTGMKASKNAKDTNKADEANESGDETLSDQQLHRLVLGVAQQNNVKFSRSGMLPWNTFARECFNGGIQIQNYPLGVTLPWNMPDDKRLRKKGVRNLSKAEQVKLAAACTAEQNRLKFQTFPPAEIQANIRPIAILAPDEKGDRQMIFSENIKELADKKLVKTEVDDSAMVVDTPEELADARKSNRRTNRSIRLGSVDREDAEDDEIDELAGGLTSDDNNDPFGIQSAQDDDDDDYGSPQKLKRKKITTKAKDKGKAKAVATPPSTPPTPTPTTVRLAQADTTPKAAKRKPPPESATKSAKRPKGDQPKSATESQPQGFTSFERIAENARNTPVSAQRISNAELGFESIPSGLPSISSARTREPPSRSTHTASTVAPTAAVPSIPTPATARAGLASARPRRAQTSGGRATAPCPEPPTVQQQRAATVPRSEPAAAIQQHQQLPAVPEAAVPPPGPPQSAHPHPVPVAVAPLQQASVVQLLQSLQGNPVLLQQLLLSLHMQGAGAGSSATGGPTGGP
ncbi:hypothetical protein PQX77_010045 [Marasmius sp. AFHP31]|nr:hypothetical protein PQX77_010045 [Marasmius sp. AFHP31]